MNIAGLLSDGSGNKSDTVDNIVNSNLLFLGAILGLNDDVIITDFRNGGLKVNGNLLKIKHIAEE